MSDEPTSDALSRASAYLDGELAAPEIAAVEADPEVMAAVARLRSLQHQIRGVPAPSPYGRDMAVAAALAEFDALQPAAAPVTPLTTLRPARRPSYGRWMAVAAAIAAVAALGAVITNAARGGSDSDDAASLASVDESAVAFDADAAERSSAGGAPAAPQPEAAQSQTMIAEATEAPPATALAADADQVAAEEAGDVAAATTAAPATTATASAATLIQFDPTTPIPDEVALGSIGRQLLDEWREGARATKTGTACDAAVPGAVLLTDAVLIVDGVDRPALIAGNPADDTISAVDPDTCVVIVTGR